MLACDLMGVNFEELKWAPRLLPAMQSLFEQVVADDGEDPQVPEHLSRCECDDTDGGTGA